MSYLCQTCDFCNNPADGKATRTNGLCKAHLNNTSAIPKKSGVFVHPKSSPLTPSFGGGTGFKKSSIRGSGF